MINSVIQGDCLDVMKQMPSEYVDLIYLDPPFNVNIQFNDFNDKFGYKGRYRGKRQIRFEDFYERKIKGLTFKYEKLNQLENLIKIMGTNQTMNKAHQKIQTFNYVYYLIDRLLECHRILRDSGSIYLHCSMDYMPFLKIAMDCIFEEKNYKNLIIWKRTINTNLAPKTITKYRNSIDTILFYSKDYKKNIFNKQYEKKVLVDLKKQFNRIDKDGKRYRLESLFKSKKWKGEIFEYKDYIPENGWKYKLKTIQQLDNEGKLIWNKNGKPYYKVFIEDAKGMLVSNLWDNPALIGLKENEDYNYSTQKPLKLLERIILASSEEHDIVLDPFCGSGTTLIAAKQLERMYIGIDINPKAIDISNTRLGNS